MNQKNIKGLFGVVAAVAALGVTGAVMQTKSNSQPDGAMQKLAHTIASTSAMMSGDPSDALTLTALRLSRPDTLDNADDAGKAAFIIAQMLAHQHYSRTEINEQISAKLLDEYLDNLDPLHFYFLKSDIAEFEPYRDQLGKLILKGDLSPSKAIFARFKQRFQAHMTYALKTIPAANFDFSSESLFQVDRKKASYPADEAEQMALWESRLKYEFLQEKLNKQKPEEIIKTLTRRYSRLERAIKELDDDDTEERYLSSLMHVYDPHSDYRGKASTENFNIQMRLSLFGIGAQLQSEDGYVKIVELIPGGPAIKSKQLKPGDRIVAVAQGDSAEPVDTVDMKVDKVVEMIRGPKGTAVRLTVIPADAPDTSTRKTVALVRDQIKLEEQAAKGRIYETPGSGGQMTRVGYIDLPSFYADDDKGKSATSDVKALLKKMQEAKVSGVVLDLRRNGGGLLDEAVNLAGLFIKTGPVVQVRDSFGRTEVKSDTDPVVAYDGPLVVLTSRLSASASEIVAGALQDYGRAVIVGDTSTFGKGTVQAVVSLRPILKSIQVATRDDPGSLTLTIQKFYRPSGASTQLEGVKPDIALPSITDVLDIAEKSLDNPLPWDTIPATSFAKTNRVQPVLAQLRQRSADRVSRDKEFALLKEQVALAQKTSQQKTISLNESKRKIEKAESETLSKRWKAQLAALPEPNEKIYSFSVADATKPGLPTPQTPRQMAEATKKATANRAPASDDTPEDVNAPIERDVLLDESKRIVLDYAGLLRK